MSFSPPGAMNSFVATTREFPTESEALAPMLEHMYTEIAQAINFREIGVFATVEVMTGKTYIDPNDQTLIRQSYRTVYRFGTVLPGVVLTIPHGLTSPFFPTLIQGTCTTARPDFRPLPFVGPWGTDLIALRVDNTNIYLSNGEYGPALNSGYITLEYVYT